MSLQFINSPLSGEVTLIKPYSEGLIYSKTMNDYRSHLGIDLTSNTNNEVCAVMDGKIANIYDDYLMGKCLTIENSEGLVTYKSLATIVPTLSKDTVVTAGQVLGTYGTSAIIEQADGAHLHLDVQVENRFIDPVTCFPDSISFKS